MPRQARMKSCTNVYHVMQRGVNRQDIFEEDADRYEFLARLRKCKEISGFRLHAFCLMSNHVHLLIEPAEEPIEQIFRRTIGPYAGWFNHKYQRVGHLFQSRYRSEIVDSEAYFKTVFRYILQNPMRAGLESRPGTYRWSSYRTYARGGRAPLTDTQFAEELFGGRENLISFVQQANEDEVMDDEEDLAWRIKDDQAKEIMRRIAGCSTVSEFQAKELWERMDCAGKMYLEKLSMGQIARLTGMSKTTIQRAVRKLDAEDRIARESVRLREEDQPSGLLWAEAADYGPGEIW